MDKCCGIIVRKRILLAILSNFALSCVIIACLTLILTLTSAKYTSQADHDRLTFTSIRLWFYYIVLLFITFLQGIVCMKKYINRPTYWKNRFFLFCGIFMTPNLSVCLFEIFIGACFSWLFISLAAVKFNNSISKCENSQDSCLIEEHLFFLLGGIWSGLYFFMKNYFTTDYLKFPIIPRSKFTCFKKRFVQTFTSSVTTSIWSTLYFIPYYYVLGSYCRFFVLFVTFTLLDSHPLDSFSRLFDLSLITHLFLVQVIYNATTNNMYLLLEIFLTQWKSFEVGPHKAQNQDAKQPTTLIDALTMDQIPIIQHLAYHDLASLSSMDPSRRSTLFVLSQPGGHPYHWNSVTSRCLELIDKLSTSLNAASPFPIQNDPAPQNQPLPNNHSETDGRGYVYRMRNLLTPQVTPSTVENTNLKLESSFNKFIKDKWLIFTKYLFSKPIIEYIFSEQEENRIHHVLLDGQVVGWAVQAISTLTVASLTEDAYGIVQKDLPKIINALLTLKQTLDKVQKSSVLMRKQYNKEDKLAKQSFMCLQSTVKRSLYKIVCNYEPYIMDLSLDTLVIEKLHNFIGYRE